MARPVNAFAIIALLALAGLGGGWLMYTGLSKQKLTPVVPQISKEDKNFYAELDGMAGRKTVASITAYIYDRMRQDPRLLAVALDWARDNSTGKWAQTDVNAFYFLLYSDLAFLAAQAFKVQGIESTYQDLSKTAFAGLLTFDLLSATDALRCADNTVREVRAPLVTPRYILLDSVFDMMSENEAQDLFGAILRAESTKAARAPNRELCASGSDGKIALLQHPGTKQEKIDMPEAPGTTRTILIAPEGFSYEPEYIAPDKWLPLRERMQAAVRDSWHQRQMNHAALKAALELKAAEEAPQPPQDTPAPHTEEKGEAPAKNE